MPLELARNTTNGENRNVADALRLLLRPQDAANAMAISPRLLWTFTKNGAIPCVRIGRSVRYDPQDLAHWIKQQKTLP